MEKLDVRIVDLPPLRVASAHGFGEGPEGLAWDQMMAWLKQRGFWKDGSDRRFFGFNNPDPSPGSPNYGYEFWMVVGPEVQGDAEATIKEFAGGLYAVTRCVGIPNIPAMWKQLVVWGEDSPYRMAQHQWLEECLTPPDEDMDQIELDLYLPIAARA